MTRVPLDQSPSHSWTPVGTTLNCFMAIVVIGGHSRNIGKTSVAAGLIAGIPERNWTAVKITQYGHGVCSINGRTCGCAVNEHTWVVNEERDSEGKGDTCRFLKAGAQRSIWVRTKQGRLAEAVPALKLTIAKAEDIIFESNSLIGFIRPALYLSVLDPATRDFKASAREFLPLADAIVLHETASQDFGWDEVSPEMLAGKLVFRVRPPRYITSEIVEFVRRRLEND